MVKIDTAKHEVKIGRKEVFLTPKEYGLLLALLNQKGFVLSRQELLAQVWGFKKNVESRSIDQHLARIRAKIGRDAIRTIVGFGYKAIAGTIR